MKYLQFTFTLSPSNSDFQDLLCAMLGEAGFDSFEPADDGQGPLQAYIRQDAYDEKALQKAIAAYPIPGTSIDYTSRQAEDKDWNAVWEHNYFQPLVVDNRCVVAGTMHHHVPEAEYKILIDPRMSFGTGHHATTSQMLSELLKVDVTGCRVLDMGCGTGILGILARMRGAQHVVAIDNDEWCVSNTNDNIALNHIDGISTQFGDASALIGQEPFDVILANINRNILLADMATYVSVMKPGALLFTSGYYTDDLPVLEACAAEHRLTLQHTRHKERWCCTCFQKKG
ncbi:MAG: 50S ribosomal protein L11 methyltransferase [Bacteroidaceae bacterium]|nr:50S ribosomal protein L11 methyltransferase [Bacteroidaceae bacterium]